MEDELHAVPEELAGGDPEDEAVADLARGPGDGDTSRFPHSRLLIAI